MFRTKKDVDRHVRTALSKLRSENEKNLRGFTIAKLYFKIHEYATAQHYVSAYLSVNEECAPAHKLLGQCLLQLKKPDKALEAFQCSLNLDPKQPDLLIEVCKMLLADENTTSLNKAKYWCDLAESENVQHNAVFSLRLKLLNKSSLETTQIEELILREISARPTDPNLRVRIVKHFIEQNKLTEAFKYAYDLEMNNHTLFADCIDWYNIVWLALNKYRQIQNSKKSWDFWLLSMICIERQVDLSFTNMNNNMLSNAGTTEIANLLFTFDQHLFEAAKFVLELSPQKELGAQFLYHFRGQLCLRAAALIYRREQILNKNQWREATRNALPLLLLAFHCGTPDLKESWLKHSGEKARQLIQTWNREGSFRCAQAGRSILSLIDDTNNESLSSQVHSVVSDQSVWANPDDLLAQVRQYCSDSGWRAKLYRILFPSFIQMQSSYLINCDQLAEPTYEMPKRSEIENYEDIAQYLKPQSLQHMVYLCIGMENLCDVKCKYFSGLNFSTQNLSFCGAESLTRLDVETFLCAAVIQAQRSFDVERIQYESYNAKNVGKPKILPYANMSSNLCTESQINWWLAAYQVYKNLAGENLGEVRATLQYGIEAVRGINGPKMDLVIILKLGKIFFTRAQDATKSVERTFLDARAVNLYKYGLTMLKLHSKGVLEPFRKLFKYNNANSAAVEREINNLAEEAVTTIASRHFKSGDYEECIDELSGIQLPYATYFQAEAYRKLDESNKTPKKTKKYYCEKAKDCLDQTLQLLSFSNDKNHPLRSIVHSDMKRTHFADMFANDELSNDIESREDFLNDSFTQSRTHRELQTSISASKTAELENLIKQMITTLAFVKEELVDRIKPEVSDIKSDISMLKEKVLTIEESLKKRSSPPSRDDGTRDFDDLYIIGDDLQQVALTQYAQQPQQASSTTQRMQTPNALLNQQPPNILHGASLPSGTNIYNNNLYNPITGNMSNSLMNQQTPHGQYGAQGAGSNVYNPHYNPNYPFTYYSQFIVPPTVMNMGLSSQQQQQQPFMPPTENNPSLYDILSMATNPPAVNAGLEKPTIDKLATNPTTNTPVGAWNRLYNNAPVEKGPPVNVVITSSDPLPTHTTVSTQSNLSVTIPPHHIKPSLVPNDLSASQPQTNTSFPIITSSLTFGGGSTVLSTIGNSVTTTQTMNAIQFTTPKLAITPSSILNKSNESTDSDIHNKSAETEYEPQVTFQPVIPLPDEVEVKTGEENEDILFSSRAKLLRLIDKEWKERGIGEIKILKGKTDGKIRILMRREQTHKMCANHYLTPEIKLIPAKGDEKSFIWCADDFADEVMKREKFCVRFKQSGMAKEFQKAFLEAQEELKSKGIARTATEQPPLGDKPQLEASQMPDKPGATPGFALSKTSVFNFGNTNTSTPKTEAKTAVIAPKIDSNKPAVPSTVSNSPFSKLNFGFTSTANSKDSTVTEASKPSPFANFSFSSNPLTTQKTDSPFANIFSKALAPSSENKPNPIEPINLATSPKSGSNLNETANKSLVNDTEVDDDYVPTAEFKPVIPLPDLVEVQTGEENEDVLFEHRARLLRFDKSTSEWKERGVGVMKILVDHNDPNRVRLVMRREQVLKLCCNQRLLKDTVFKYAQNSNSALTWVGQDFSESELQAEILAIRFKTPDICKEFHSAILKAQEKMTAGDNGQKGNKENINTTIGNKVQTVTGSKIATKDKTDNSSQPEGFGDQFKPKPGSWSCGACYTSNMADVLYCVACEEPKDDTVPKKSSFGAFNAIAPTKPAFTFGFSTPSNTPKQVDATQPTPVGFGDKFKPKIGSWTCQGCYVQNDGDKLYCGACESPKDDTVPKKEPVSNIFAPSSTAPKFQFGFSSTTVDSGKTSASTSIKPVVTESVKTTAPSIVAAPDAKQNPFDFVPKTGFTFGTPTNNVATNIFSPSTDGKTPFALSPSTMFGVTSEASKANLLSKLVTDVTQKTTTKTDDKSNGEYRLEKQEFNFQLKPKSPGKAKSPARNLSGTVEEESAEEEDLEEENNTYFAPVIPLPDKVDVVTGEENEEQLYCHRAKLYRFALGEWKERGVGDIKILRHNETKKLRVVMRREKIHKICLNHVLTPDIEYKPKDEKSWHFAANDFSEGEFQSTVFSIRFKNKDIAENFMAAIKEALKDNAESANNSKETTPTPDRTGLSDEQIKLADRLKLPYSFYQIDDSKKCPGCRGCDPDKFEFSQDATKNDLVDDKSPIPLTMPQISFQNKSILKQSVLAKPTFKTSNEDSTAKSIFGGGTMFSKPNISESNSTASTTMEKFTFNLNNANTESTQESSLQNKFISGGFLFGSSKTAFGTSADNAKPVFGQSIFGGTSNASTATTIFGGVTTNATIFDGTNNSALSSTTGNIFGNKTGASSQAIISAESQNNLFSNLNLKPAENQTQPIFGGKAKFSFGNSFGSTFATAGSIFGDALNKNNMVKDTNGATNNPTQESPNKENEPKKDSNEPLFKNDPGLSFASLAATADTQPTFKPALEGQGGFVGLKQSGDFSIFLTSAKDIENRLANTSNTSQDGASIGQDDASYDPHYEPIIELPELITVSTGEENEEKLFGERGVLYRYDTTNKEWKERGTGEVKILHHAEKGTYRLLLRREQIHKLVLNHAITADFQLKPMNTSGKSFCWGAMNYAENPPELERLAVRFKNVELAMRFENEVLQCVEKLKQRGAELEPEED